MMLLQTTAAAKTQSRWCVPHGDGQTLRVRRRSADSPAAARAAAQAQVMDQDQMGRPGRLVFIGEDAPHNDH